SIVAVKSIKKAFSSASDGARLREVNALKHLDSNPFIVQVYEVVYDASTRLVHISMEYMPSNLYQLMQARQGVYLDPASVRQLISQILAGLVHIHSSGWFHRDIKPENILVSSRGENALSYSVKIADFGLSRQLCSSPPYTNYVSTRWYRAPEMLLQCPYYSAPSDMWALGAVAMELATLRPLVPGANMLDQLLKVFRLLGCPDPEKMKSPTTGGSWAQASVLASKIGINFPVTPGIRLESLIPAPSQTPNFPSFCAALLCWNPHVRLTAQQALQHPYIQ
ncbi:hypothetical protein CANCADRAFT_19418, partial [Tortispora caseinolytica NRRL Y-17796]